MNNLKIKLEGKDEVTLRLSCETNNYAAIKLQTTSKGDALSTDKYSSSGTFNATGNVYTGTKAGLMSGSLTSPMIVEFDLDIKALPEDKSATPSKAVTGSVNCGNGISVEVIDAFCDKDVTNSSGTPMISELMKFGFYNEGGKLYLRHATSAAYAEVLLSDSTTGAYHVRVEYTYKPGQGETAVGMDTPVSAKYFVNGLFVAEADNVRVATTASTGTGSLEQLRIRPAINV